MQDLAFIDALLSARDPAPGMRVGLQAQQLAEAVYQAARTGDEIELARFSPADIGN